MKIGLVRRGYSRTGGAEAYLRRFADAASAAGHRILLFSEHWPREEWHFDLVPVTSHSPRSFADAMVALRPRDRCDFLFSLERIHTCDAYRAGDGVHAAWLERRAKFEPAWKSWFRRFSGKHREILALEKELFGPRGARAVIANSRLVREEIVRHFQYPEEKIQVIHNGVPLFTAAPEARAHTRASLGLQEDDYAILFAGSGWSRKGLRYAIEAVNLAKLDGAHLLIAGRGNPHALPKCAQARFLGPVKDMPPLLAAADAFILPTIYDPFSNACLEALAAGLPVITTAQNGFSEIIESGLEGEIVNEPNDIPALASAITAWSDPDRRAIAKLRLEILSTQYTIAENVRQTLAAIQALR
ncbi:MAG: glycosyltransferase family 4 protein [Chthoniobacter sp.]